ncbi:hypothetical protein RFI_14191 [Reticulomyxa filosa]|uniref:Uncharacterized protein n=1 Tax=Reticulomyxa filosa TaxID=46433 RepID=X6NB60_RETFI|nr:hypothetical protein RFI_14191 [Reticulomyxa filosa]|eukprot:ETO22994.1 hypothetical protein RFI_14191 [Reticulomyxa filosa]
MCCQIPKSQLHIHHIRPETKENEQIVNKQTIVYLSQNAVEKLALEQNHITKEQLEAEKGTKEEQQSLVEERSHHHVHRHEYSLSDDDDTILQHPNDYNDITLHENNRFQKQHANGGIDNTNSAQRELHKHMSDAVRFQKERSIPTRPYRVHLSDQIQVSPTNSTTNLSQASCKPQSNPDQHKTQTKNLNVTSFEIERVET